MPQADCIGARPDALFTVRDRFEPVPFKVVMLYPVPEVLFPEHAPRASATEKPAVAIKLVQCLPAPPMMLARAFIDAVARAKRSRESRIPSAQQRMARPPRDSRIHRRCE